MYCDSKTKGTLELSNIVSLELLRTIANEKGSSVITNRIAAVLDVLCVVDFGRATTSDGT